MGLLNRDVMDRYWVQFKTAYSDTSNGLKVTSWALRDMRKFDNNIIAEYNTVQEAQTMCDFLNKQWKLERS